jgi:large subunit ribosomal protein L35
MPKNKVHKGLLKRVKVTKTGKVKYKTCASSHLKSHKSPKTLMKLRKLKTASSPEAKRFSKLLHRRLRGRDQPLSSIRRSPSPEQRRAAREAAAAE